MSAKQQLSRRRALTIMAGTGAAIAASPLALRLSPQTPELTWRGRAMGTDVTITLADLDEAMAKRALRTVIDEVDRLENIFSLYRPHSEISRLNQNGELTGASLELTSLLGTAQYLFDVTNGIFNPAIQPLWRALADNSNANFPRPAHEILLQTGSLMHFEEVTIGGDVVRFGTPGMAITLNGIAQGYVTDRARAVLESFGYERVLIDLGEIAAIAPIDAPQWNLGLNSHARRGQVRPIQLQGGALATSAPSTLTLDKQADVGHLLAVQGGSFQAPLWQTVSVEAPSAALADGLATALCFMDQEASQLLIRECGAQGAHFEDQNGNWSRFCAGQRRDDTGHEEA